MDEVRMAGVTGGSYLYLSFSASCKMSRK